MVKGLEIEVSMCILGILDRSWEGAPWTVLVRWRSHLYCVCSFFYTVTCVKIVMPGKTIQVMVLHVFGSPDPGFQLPVCGPDVVSGSEVNLFFSYKCILQQLKTTAPDHPRGCDATDHEGAPLAFWECA